MKENYETDSEKNLDYYLKVAKKAIKYARSKGLQSSTASNLNIEKADKINRKIDKMRVLLHFAQRKSFIGTKLQEEEEETLKQSKKWAHEYLKDFKNILLMNFTIADIDMQNLRINKKIVSNQEVGNCEELSEIVFWYLRKLDIPGEVLFLENHVIVAFNMAEGYQFSDYKTWGENAIICDALNDKYYLASEFENKFTGYFCDFEDEENPNKFVPFNEIKDPTFQRKKYLKPIDTNEMIEASLTKLNEFKEILIKLNNQKQISIDIFKTLNEKVSTFEKNLAYYKQETGPQVERAHNRFFKEIVSLLCNSAEEKNITEALPYVKTLYELSEITELCLKSLPTNSVTFKVFKNINDVFYEEISSADKIKKIHEYTMEHIEVIKEQIVKLKTHENTPLICFVTKIDEIEIDMNKLQYTK